MSYMQTLFRKGIIFFTPNSFSLKSRLSNGAVIFGSNKAGYGGRGVFISRDRIEPELEILDELLKSDDVFIDIGANTGVYTMKAAKIVGSKGTVVACEPFPDIFRMLIKSVKYNKYNNVRLRNVCAGDRKALARFYLNFNRPHCYSLNKVDEAADYIQVPVITLDELTEWESLKKVSYIKIDAEGAEEAIIRGGLQSIKQFRPVMQMETIPADIQNFLPDYKCFCAPKSPNRLFIPTEHKYIGVLNLKGWDKIS